VSNKSISALDLPKDVWSHILHSNIHIFDTIFIRATSKLLLKLCKEIRPFPKHFVLDQELCMAYLIQHGFISCIEYAKTALDWFHDWHEKFCATAAAFGQVDALKYLRSNFCEFGGRNLSEACAEGTCSLDMIKYLHESGIPWGDPNRDEFMALAARKGHLACMQYAVENGCKNRKIAYTPFIDCLQYAIDNEFSWKGRDNRRGGTAFFNRRDCHNICEQAANEGDIVILKHAFQHGAPLNDSAIFAARSGHLGCMIFAVENDNQGREVIPSDILTIECFNYLLQKFGIEKLSRGFKWNYPLKTNAKYLQAILASGIPFPKTLHGLTRFAVQSPETVLFFLEHAKLSKDSTHVLQECSEYGSLDTLKVVYDKLASDKEISSEKLMQLVKEPICFCRYQNEMDKLKFLWDKLPNKQRESVRLRRWLNDYETVTRSTPEVLDFFANQGIQWQQTHLGYPSSFPNTVYLLRLGRKFQSSRSELNQI
jgi:hypothetical protein